MNARPRNQRAIGRRQLLAGAGALAAVGWLSAPPARAASRGPKLSGYPFTLGVASGDPEPDAVVIWTRLAPEPLAPGGGMPAHPVARATGRSPRDPRMTRVVRRGTALAPPEAAHTVHVDRPGAWIPTAGTSTASRAGRGEPVGRTRTAPRAGAPSADALRIRSCQDFENGFFTAYRQCRGRPGLRRPPRRLHLRGRDARRDVRRHVGGELVTLDDYRIRYAHKYRPGPAGRARGASRAPSPGTTTRSRTTTPDDLRGPRRDPQALPRRRAAAYQAYYEHLPLRVATAPRAARCTSSTGCTSAARVELHVLDTRQHRTDQPCGDGLKPVCRRDGCHRPRR